VCCRTTSQRLSAVAPIADTHRVHDTLLSGTMNQIELGVLWVGVTTVTGWRDEEWRVLQALLT